MSLLYLKKDYVELISLVAKLWPKEKHKRKMVREVMSAAAVNVSAFCDKTLDF